MIKRIASYLLRIIVILGVIAPMSLAISLPASAAPITFSTLGTGSCITGRVIDTVYNTARMQATSGISYTTSLDIGQNYGDPNYAVWRSFVYFDTSSISDSANITSATLSLYGSTDGSIVDFNITIQSDNGTSYPHDPYVAADYDQSLYVDSGGTFNTASFVTGAYNDITLNATGIGWINLTGTTKLALRSSRDIAGSVPTGNEYIVCQTSTVKLTIVYTEGTPSAPVVTTLSAVNIMPTSAVLRGSLDSIGSENISALSFQYGTTTSYGTFTAEQTVTTTGSYDIEVEGLQVAQTYHFQAVSRFGASYYYGLDMTFSTLYATGSSTDIIVRNGAVFNSYITSGDMLFTVEVINNYPPYYPSQNPAEYFQLQLLSTNGTAQLGTSPIVQWGDRPESIYLNATAASGLVDKSAYILKVVNVSSVNFTVSANYTLLTRDWKGSVLSKLDNWCIQIATNMQSSDGNILTNPYTQVVTGRGVIITDYAGGYFTLGIAGIAQIRPNLFSSAEKKNTVTSMNATVGYNTGSTLSDRIGATMAADALTVGSILGLSGQQLLLYMILAVVLGFIIFTVSKTQGFGALGALCIAVPIIGASSYFNIMNIAIPTMLVVVFLILFVRQFFWKTL
jgi:hypothetical protein